MHTFKILLFLLLFSINIYAISEEQAKGMVQSYLDIGESMVPTDLTYKGSKYWIIDVYSGERRSFTVLIDDESSRILLDKDSMVLLFKAAYKSQWVFGKRDNTIYTLKTKNQDLKSRFTITQNSVEQAQELDGNFNFGKITQKINDIIFQAEDTEMDIADAIDIEEIYRDARTIENLDDLLAAYQKVYDGMYVIAEHADIYVDMVLNMSLEISKSSSSNKDQLQTLIKPPISKSDSTAFKSDALRWKRELEQKDKEFATEANKSANNFLDRKTRKDAENALKNVEVTVTSLIAIERELRVCGIESISDLKEAYSDALLALKSRDYPTVKEKVEYSNSLISIIQDAYQKCSFSTPKPSTESSNPIIPGILIVALIGGAYYYYSKKKKPEVKIEGNDDYLGAKI